MNRETFYRAVVLEGERADRAVLAAKAKQANAARAKVDAENMLYEAEEVLKSAEKEAAVWVEAAYYLEQDR